ncbi:carboxylate--amine ligase [Mycolicibacterium novocastrense]|uniref:glutamate--cysteine ligase 2 n=1 Tax=Mycolicibacterium novocastrense TaxID=59813 RepID=UPI00074A6C1E|nr:glutamate--cysteine ligase [Mycolicibacterium novocastrense]KUH70093.1 carboxylate--amine ligase [Mycolicibacterium novocastrense]KUH78266.1 carboxylate--amine ligase [Mycolicibacterium novocastrense]KUH79601.1 carboxylate--amine ligase [Mycolicibacterium novocastrense]
MATHPTIGVEEEFLLVDPTSGEPVALNEAVAREAADRGVKLQLELTTCQVETTSEVVGSTRELRDQLLRLRRLSAEAADAAGARLLAVGLPPTLPREFPITDTPRYREIGEKFGMIAHEQGICGCHVHVAVPSREAAIRVSNRLRPWLPTLLALSANSAIYRNSDTGYASWRSVLWARWPSAGPPPHFDSVDEYDAVVTMLQQAGAMRDDGMVYWDVRPSKNFPTIEVRVADVPATVAETVLLAALTRAAVMTALQDERRGEPTPPLAAHALKAAYWKSARDGLDGDAVDLLESHQRVPARELLDRLVEHVRPALEAVGDYDLVFDELRRVTEHGNGAIRQRRAWQRRRDVRDVLAEAAEATMAGT